LEGLPERKDAAFLFKDMVGCMMFGSEGKMWQRKLQWSYHHVHETKFLKVSFYLHRN
jgi:hypothetical protein